MLTAHRFRKEETRRILPFCAFDQMRCRWRCAPSPEEILHIVLIRLAFPVRWVDLCDVFGRSRAWLSSVFNDAVGHLFRRWGDRLFWDAGWLTRRRMRRWARAIEEEDGGDIYWGWIDGAARRIGRPEQDQRTSYSGYKKTHVFNVQSIVTPDGMIASLYGPCAGIVNDPRMVRMSGLEIKLREVSFHLVLTSY